MIFWLLDGMPQSTDARGAFRQDRASEGKYPEKLRGKLIPVIYVCLPMPELVEEAAKRKVWVLKATQDFCKPEKA
jgi:hypothetical protein